MNFELPRIDIDIYKSASQRARVGTESWGAANLFCPCCDSPKLNVAPKNTVAIDYRCLICSQTFQLKSQSKLFGAKILDSAYSEMKRAIVEDRTPNLYVLHYDLPSWTVRSLILVPHFAFTLSAVERRPPLAPTARRAGWVGCNILLDRIPNDARISIINDGVPALPADVRDAYQRLRPLEKLNVEKRGWTLDVLNVVQSLRSTEFTLVDVYAHADALAKLHPQNFHVRDKIRQQLQILRDMKLLQFLGDGHYRLT